MRNAEKRFRIADPGLRLAGWTAAFIIILLARGAIAANPWESIANMLAARRAHVSTATVTLTPAGAPALPALPEAMGRMIPLHEVPDESATSASRSASNALAAMGLTTATAMKAVATGPGKETKPIELGRESDENDTMLATNLFKNKDIRRLLGDEPKFIYDPAQRPDPMVVPWVRRAAIFKELSDSADALTAQGKYDEAVAVYRKILDLRDPRFTEAVQGKLAAIAQKQNTAAVEMAQALPVEMPVELPAWIHDNTTGVIVSPGTEMCLIGEYMLHKGDRVPNYPDVTIASIASRKVVFQIRNRNFEVVLNPN